MTLLTAKPRKAKRKPIAISDEVYAYVHAAEKLRARPKVNPFEIKRQAFPVTTGATLAMDAAQLALDDAFGSRANWAYQNYAVFDSMLAEGQVFLGFPTLAVMAQRPEYHAMVSILSDDMTRKWIELKSSADADDKSGKIKAITDKAEALKVRKVFKEWAQQAFTYGRGHAFIDLGVTADRKELAQSIGFGSRSALTTLKVDPHSFVDLKVIEPVWCSPGQYETSNPLRPNWYAPESWYVQSDLVHSTRLMTMIPFPVSDMLKPAYFFGGVPLIQMAKPYVDNFLNTRQDVADMIRGFVTYVLKTDMGDALTGGSGNSLIKRIEMFNRARSNRGTFIIDKEREEFSNVTAALTGLEALQSQAYEQLASVARIPLVKLAGISPSGLNACLTGETLITTDRGAIPIRDVTLEHKVLTRRGFANLTFSGVTKHATELMEIRTESATIRCTPNHPIWLPSKNAFVAAEHVLVGERLLSIGERAGIQSTLRQSRGAGVGGGVTQRAITRHLIGRRNSRSSSIGLSGRHISARSLTDAISTTWTAIKRTISRATLRLSPAESMLPSIASMIADVLLPKESPFAVETAAGTSSSRSFRAGEYCAAVNAPWQSGALGNRRRRNLLLSAYAALVGTLSQPGEGTRSSAPESAQRRAKTDRSTCEAIIAATQRSSVVSVRRVPADEPVYDLTVAGGALPEFFANGVLVHNSSEGEIRVYYDSIHSMQEALFGDPLRFVLDLIQLDLFGQIDPDITFEFVQLYELTEVEKAQLRKTDADTGAVLIQSGVIDSAEERQRVASDPDTPYVDLDPAKLPPPPQQPGAEADPSAGGQGDEDPLVKALSDLRSPAQAHPPVEAGGTPSAPFSPGASPLARDAFNPQEPRGQPGNAGEWTSGGGSPTSKPEPSKSDDPIGKLISGIMPAQRETGLEAQRAAIENEHKLGIKTKWSGYDPSLKAEYEAKWQAEADAKANKQAAELAKIRSLAEKYDINPDEVFFEPNRPTSHMLGISNDVLGVTIGGDDATFNGKAYKRNSVVLFGDDVPKGITREQVLAHEATHVKWNVVMDKVAEEAKHISADMVDNEGVLKPVYAKLFPNYAALSPYLGFAFGKSKVRGIPRQLEKLYEDDGVTAYSAAHWKQWETQMDAAMTNGTHQVPPVATAISETLSEIAGTQAAPPGDPAAQVSNRIIASSPLWQGLYKALTTCYANIRTMERQRGAGKVAAE